MTFVSRRLFPALMIMLLIGTMFLGKVDPVHAAVIPSVTVTAGSADTFGNSPNACSLREAIWAVNNRETIEAKYNKNFDGCKVDKTTDTILLPPGNYQLKIAGSGEDQGKTGDLDIWTSMKIIGSGPGEGQTRIFADNNISTFLDRIFHVKGKLDSQGKPTITVEVSNLRIQGGYTTQVGGGGILNENADLKIFRVYFKQNEVYGGGTWGGD